MRTKKPGILFLSILITLLGATSQLSYGQAIRKNYSEMTAQEKVNYVNVVNTLYTGGTITQYVNDHLAAGSGGFAQHGNVNFLGWHRIYLYYFEKALQATNPKVSLVYWDWTTDWSASSNLFSNGSTATGLFGNPLNATWTGTISRSIGSSPMAQPTSAYLNTLVSSAASYSSFASGLEGNPHNGAHCWIGGTMCNVNFSPRDPVFYQHHTMVDKVFQDWTEAKWNGATIAGISTSLGTITGKPVINSNNIIDSRALKVWYAVNNSVTIDKYTVSNTTLGVSTGDEQYNYTGTIKFATDTLRYFYVPSGQTAKAISGQEIILNVGFQAAAGSVFEATINTTHFNTPKIGTDDFDPAIFAEESASEALPEEFLRIYPNPSSGVFNLLLSVPENTTYQYVVYDAIGNTVDQKKDQKERGFQVDMTGRQPGMYILKLNLDNGKFFTETLVID